MEPRVRRGKSGSTLERLQMACNQAALVVTTYLDSVLARRIVKSLRVRVQSNHENGCTSLLGL